jgi:hypothetical protein
MKVINGEYRQLDESVKTSLGQAKIRISVPIDKVRAEGEEWREFTVRKRAIEPAHSSGGTE